MARYNVFVNNENANVFIDADWYAQDSSGTLDFYMENDDDDKDDEVIASFVSWGFVRKII